jgi:protein TonB
LARAAAIDGGEWAGAGSAPVASGARLLAARRPDRDPSSAPAHGGLIFAALVSLSVHAAIVAAVGLSLGAPQPTGEPNAVAVEWVAASDKAAAPAPATDADLARATRPPRDDSAPPASEPPSPPPDAALPAKTPDAAPATSKPAETANEAAAAAPQATDEAPAAAPPAPPDVTPSTSAPDVASATPTLADAANEAIPAPPATDEAPAAAAAPPSPPQVGAVPPESNLAAASTAPRVEPKSPTAPPRAEAVPPESDFGGATAAPQMAPKSPAVRPPPPHAGVGFKPASRPAAARPASAPARGVAGIADYRALLLAKISGATRYPEAARERGATGVATVHFALDGAGAVTLADLAQSSGDRALDDEALAAVRRASPLPAPPAGAPRAYSAPIRFELR